MKATLEPGCYLDHVIMKIGIQFNWQLTSLQGKSDKMHGKIRPYLGNNCNKLRFPTFANIKGIRSGVFPMHRWDQEDLLDELDEFGWIGSWRRINTDPSLLCAWQRTRQRLNAFQFDPQFNSFKCKYRPCAFIERPTNTLYKILQNLI